jgi:hypothetical protein
MWTIFKLSSGFKEILKRRANHQPSAKWLSTYTKNDAIYVDEVAAD